MSFPFNKHIAVIFLIDCLFYRTVKKEASKIQQTTSHIFKANSQSIVTLDKADIWHYSFKSPRIQVGFKQTELQCYHVFYT